MGKFILYGLLVVGASSLANWVTLGKSAGAGYTGARGGGYIGSPGGFGGSGHK